MTHLVETTLADARLNVRHQINPESYLRAVERSLPDDTLGTIGNISGDDIIGALVPYCRKNISSAHLMGFLMAPWTHLDERGANYDRQMKAIDLFAAALG